MLSKSKIKYIHSLEKKKNRDAEGVFIAEGNKLVSDLLQSNLSCSLLVAQAAWMATQGDIPTKELIDAEAVEINKASLLKHPQDVIAIFKKPETKIEDADPTKDLVLMLDGIQDPGNLGTIIRIADWYGIHHIICSIDTVDVFNPKTVQATMGAIARVKVYYTELDSYIANYQKQKVPVYGTLLDGDNMYNTTFTTNGIIIMGNEGNGIRPSIASMVNKKLFIPNYPAGSTTSESLNVAVATAIVCAEFRRRQQ